MILLGAPIYVENGEALPSLFKYYSFLINEREKRYDYCLLLTLSIGCIDITSTKHTHTPFPYNLSVCTVYILADYIFGYLYLAQESSKSSTQTYFIEKTVFWKRTIYCDCCYFPSSSFWWTGIQMRRGGVFLNILYAVWGRRRRQRSFKTARATVSTDQEKECDASSNTLTKMGG